MASTNESDASIEEPASTSTTNAPYRVPTIGEAAEGDEFAGVDEIKGSMCMACGGDGTTRMLTTKIPFFREVILSSFECDDCHWRNNEVRVIICRCCVVRVHARSEIEGESTWVCVSRDPATR